MKLNDLVVIGMAGGLGLSLLVAGVRGLSRGRLTVVNPHHRSAWPNVLGTLIQAARRSTGLQDDSLAESRTAVVEGREARGRAWFYIALGLACSLVALAHLVNTGPW